ncbi:hypothetical protein, partial [Pyramidobacter porci]
EPTAFVYLLSLTSFVTLQMEFPALCSMINLPPRLPKILYFFLIETLDSGSVSIEIRTVSCAAGEIVLSARALLGEPSGIC